MLKPSRESLTPSFSVTFRDYDYPTFEELSVNLNKLDFQFAGFVAPANEVGTVEGK